MSYEKLVSTILESQLKKSSKIIERKITLNRSVGKEFRRWLVTDKNLTIKITMNKIIEASLDKHVESELRKYLGSANAKNYNNIRRSNHVSTTTTKHAINTKLGPLIFLFPITPLKNKEASLTPEADLHINLIGEELLNWNKISKVHKNIICENCHHDIYTTSAVWWENTELHIDAELANTIDRIILLNLTLIKFLKEITCILIELKALDIENTLNLPNISNLHVTALDLCNSEKTPFNYWLALLKNNYLANNLNDLSDKLNNTLSLSGTDDEISHSLLRKWSSSQQLPSAKTAQLLISKSPEKETLLVSYYIARQRQLIITLIRSSSKKNISNNTAAIFLNKRWKQLLTAEESFHPA